MIQILQQQHFTKINIVYFRLKASIFFMRNTLLITVNYHELTCGQKVVRCVSRAYMTRINLCAVASTAIL